MDGGHQCGTQGRGMGWRVWAQDRGDEWKTERDEGGDSRTEGTCVRWRVRCWEQGMEWCRMEGIGTGQKRQTQGGDGCCGTQGLLQDREDGHRAKEIIVGWRGMDVGFNAPSWDQGHCGTEGSDLSVGPRGQMWDGDGCCRTEGKGTGWRELSWDREDRYGMEGAVICQTGWTQNRVFLVGQMGLS